jgi:hypothetical protein
MTMHEALIFLDALHRHIEHSVSKRGPWCWPTRELVHYNLGLNRSCFPRDKRVYDSFNRQFKVALSKHWAEAGPCASRCHAVHLRLTGEGTEVLCVMNEHGCGPHCNQHREPRLRLQRKVA